MISTSSSAQSEGKAAEGALSLNFWNGNRSFERQEYERKVLIAVLEATEPQWGQWEIREFLDAYPGDEESLAFTEKAHDLLVTVAGNTKFSGHDFITIPYPLTKNLLGYRIPVIRREDAFRFESAESREELQNLVHGIPQTWSDANIFRENGFNVAEEGTLETIFDNLASGRFDYTAFGANEILSICSNLDKTYPELMIEPTLLLHYPIPLVFYVHPEKPQLAERISDGMVLISESGVLDELFSSQYGAVPEKLGLDSRKVVMLENKHVPASCREMLPDTESIAKLQQIR